MFDPLGKSFKAILLSGKRETKSWVFEKSFFQDIVFEGHSTDILRITGKIN